MNFYIATFHTHLSAIRSQKRLMEAGIATQLSPVPRSLSASCGTCIRYQNTDPRLDCMDHDYEKIVRVIAVDQYEVEYENE